LASLRLTLRLKRGENSLGLVEVNLEVEERTLLASLRLTLRFKRRRESLRLP